MTKIIITNDGHQASYNSIVRSLFFDYRICVRLAPTRAAERFGEFNGKYSKEIWSVATTGYTYFNGLAIGNTSEVTWKLKAGDFKWLRLTIMEIAYK